MPDIADLTRQLDQWNEFPTSEAHQQGYFSKNVKPLLPQASRLLNDQAAAIDKLTRDLRAAEAMAAEYKTRAESQDKINAKQKDDFAKLADELRAEVDGWKQKHVSVTGDLDAANNKIEGFRRDIITQQQQLNVLVSKIVETVRNLNAAVSL